MVKARTLSVASFFTRAYEHWRAIRQRGAARAFSICSQFWQPLQYRHTRPITLDFQAASEQTFPKAVETHLIRRQNERAVRIGCRPSKLNHCLPAALPPESKTSQKTGFKTFLSRLARDMR